MLARNDKNIRRRSSVAEQGFHKAKITGSNPVAATKNGAEGKQALEGGLPRIFRSESELYGVPRLRRVRLWRKRLPSAHIGSFTTSYAFNSTERRPTMPVQNKGIVYRRVFFPGMREMVILKCPYTRAIHYDLPSDNNRLLKGSGRMAYLFWSAPKISTDPSIRTLFDQNPPPIDPERPSEEKEPMRWINRKNPLL